MFMLEGAYVLNCHMLTAAMAACMHADNSSAHLPKQCQETSQLSLVPDELITNTSRIASDIFSILSKSYTF